MADKSRPYNARPGWGYKALRCYVRFFHDYFYYSKVYWLDVGNIPRRGGVMLVSDHQNGLSDALGFVVSVDRADRKLRMIARADVFRSFFGPILTWMGILPAYRSIYKGTGSAVRNRYTFEQAQQELLMGGTVGIYPEAGHQDKHWLGRFSVGYLHIVFEAARNSGFEKDIFIVPSCNHYSDYTGMREQMLIRYGEPVPARPYYDLYRTNPVEARRQFNEVVREKVSEMMLNITDLENYEAIDYLRNTYGVGYSRRLGYDPEKLPDKLMSDKRFFAQVDNLKKENVTAIQEIYDDTMRLKEGTEKLRIGDKYFGGSPSQSVLALWVIVLVLLAPLFIVACIPNVLLFHLPRMVTAKVEDKMLHSGIHFGASVLLVMPLLYLITFILVWVFISFPVAIVHLICLPFLGIFAWKYSRAWRQWLGAVRFARFRGTEKMRELRVLRKDIYERLDRVLGL